MYQAYNAFSYVLIHTCQTTAVMYEVLLMEGVRTMYHCDMCGLIQNACMPRSPTQGQEEDTDDSRYWHPLKSSWHPLLVCTLILVISACTVSTVVLSQVRREPPRGQQYGTYEKTRHNTRTCQAGIEINVSIEKWVGLINITSFHYSNGFYSVDVGVKP